MTPQERELMQMALDAYESRMQQIGGCSDGGCVVVKPKGMHTNGGCRCWKNERSMQRLAMAANNLTKALRAALAQPEQEELGEIIPADEEQLNRIAKLVEQEQLPKKSKGALSHEENKQHNKMILDKFYEENAHLYIAPPQREWQGLTNEDRMQIWEATVKYVPGELRIKEFACSLESLLKEKNK